MNPDRLTVPANDELVAFVEAMTAPEAPGDTIEKLVGVYRVLIPHKIAAYTYHLNNTSTITDAPTMRSLKFALQDEFDDWRDGEMLIQSLTETPDHVDRATAHQAEAREVDVGCRGNRRARIDRLANRRRRSNGPGGRVVKKHLPADELARDQRFVRSQIMDGFNDPRVGNQGNGRRGPQKLVPALPDAPERARALMHGIFVGEMQALEGAGRTCFDFEVGKGTDDTTEVPFELKLDMARQCWDEARHCEISVKLGDWMGTEIGEYGEQVFLYEAACAPDPLLRLTGVNRALEGLAIDVFNTMREFGQVAGDPVLEFCEDWMLADEVTHVKMGSDWLRRLTENDKERRDRRSSSSARSTVCSRSVASAETRTTARCAWRAASASWPGSTNKEIDEIAELSTEARAMMEQRMASAASIGRHRQLTLANVTVSPETFTMVDYDAGEIAALVERLADRSVRATATSRSGSTSRCRSAVCALPRPIPSCWKSTVARSRTRSDSVSSTSSAATRTIGRLLFEAQDLLRPDFGTPPDREDLELPQRVAWDAYASGRLARLGYDAQQQRWRYAFRTRHGFNDEADRAFDLLWSGDALTWADIQQLSAELGPSEVGAE